MKKQFRFFPPTPLNNLTYLIALAILLPLIQFFGQGLLNTLNAHFSEPTVFIGFGFSLYLTVFWGWGLFYIALDQGRGPAFLEKYRIQVTAPGAPDRNTSPTTASAVRVVLINQFAGTLPGLVLLYLLLRAMEISVRDPVPSTGVILLKLGGMILVEEALFYLSHFLMHQKPLFRRFHHIHHRFRQPIGISTHYVHFVEHLVGNLIPIFAAIVLTRGDVTTSFLWVGMAVTNAIHTHSDYAFPWMSVAVHHDFHHYVARGNYGAIGLLDWLFGTDKEYRAFIAKESAKTEGRVAA
jgi:methylsterol monooxygenase